MISTNSRPSQLAVFLAWWVAGLAIFIGIWAGELGFPLDGGSLAVLGLGPLMIALDRRWFPMLFLGPVSFMYAIHALGYAVGPLLQLHVVGSVRFDEAGFVRAQWGAVAGLWTFVLLFHLTSGSLRRHLAPRRKIEISVGEGADRWPRYVLVMTALVFLSMFYAARSGALGGVEAAQGKQGILTVFNIVAPLTYPMFFFQAYMSRRRGNGWTLLWLAAIVAYSMYWGLLGGRGAIAFAAIFSALGWTSAGGPARRVVLLGLVGMLIFVPLAAVMEGYRVYVQQGTSDTDIRSRIDIFVRVTEGFTQLAQTPADVAEPFSRGVTARFVDQVFVLTPSVIPYTGLEGIENVVYIFTPKVILPNRPNLEEGNELAIKYGAMHAVTGWYMPTVGAGYTRAGWLGVILLYAANTVIFAAALALAWTRRARWEWMTLLVALTLKIPDMWAATLTSTFYFSLSVLPRMILTFLAIRIATDYCARLMRGRSGAIPRPAVL